LGLSHSKIQEPGCQRRCVVVRPYQDTQQEINRFTRLFENTVNTDELVWHRDAIARNIRVVEGKNWKLQFDNDLPFLLNENQEYHIPANTYHRVIKGDSNLLLDIREVK